MRNFRNWDVVAVINFYVLRDLWSRCRSYRLSVTWESEYIFKKDEIHKLRTKNIRLWIINAFWVKVCELRTIFCKHFEGFQLIIVVVSGNKGIFCVKCEWDMKNSVKCKEVYFVVYEEKMNLTYFLNIKQKF